VHRIPYSTTKFLHNSVYTGPIKLTLHNMYYFTLSFFAVAMNIG